MVYRFLWANGVLDTASGYGKVHHADMMTRMMNDGRLESDKLPEDYIAGDYMQDELHGGQFDQLKIIWEQGSVPSQEELIHMLKQRINGSPF
jgi:hypothetical protein